MENETQGTFDCSDNKTEYITTLQGQIGLTKREYFAAMAMQGYIAEGKWSHAKDWVRCADLLIKALETKSE